MKEPPGSETKRTTRAPAPQRALMAI